MNFGMLMAPFGEGRNAPPSNENIARVAVATLANPGPHIGKSYRPGVPRNTGTVAYASMNEAGMALKTTGEQHVQCRETLYHVLYLT